jgi:DCN1-like protein 1/2
MSSCIALLRWVYSLHILDADQLYSVVTRTMRPFLTFSRYYSNAPAGPSPARTKLNKVFDKYRDNPSEPDEIGPEGVSQLLGDMQIGLEDIGALIFSEIVSSPTLGVVTRDGFCDGCEQYMVDDLPRIRNQILMQKASLRDDKNVFKPTYDHTFKLMLPTGAKTVPTDTAIEFWRMLFSNQGYEWKSKQGTPWLDWWLEYLQSKNTKAVNNDLWKQTLSFAYCTMNDDSLSFWNEESSWPSVIDEFVEWVKKEKRLGQGEDAMEVE